MQPSETDINWETPIGQRTLRSSTYVIKISLKKRKKGKKKNNEKQIKLNQQSRKSITPQSNTMSDIIKEFK